MGSSGSEWILHGCDFGCDSDVISDVKIYLQILHWITLGELHWWRFVPGTMSPTHQMKSRMSDLKSDRLNRLNRLKGEPATTSSYLAASLPLLIPISTIPQ